MSRSLRQMVHGTLARVSVAGSDTEERVTLRYQPGLCALATRKVISCFLRTPPPQSPPPIPTLTPPPNPPPPHR